MIAFISDSSSFKEIYEGGEIFARNWSIVFFHWETHFILRENLNKGTGRSAVGLKYNLNAHRHENTYKPCFYFAFGID